MARLVGLQMISFGVLLFFNDHITCPAAARSSGCISAEKLNKTLDKFRRIYWDRLRFSRSPQDAQTCAQVAAAVPGDLNKRSLSPWRYRLDKEDNRCPHEIPFAECLCQGCIINRREDMSYNSVPVYASLMVMRKSRCPRDPHRYVVQKFFIQVPMGCTCAVPKYMK